MVNNLRRQEPARLAFNDLSILHHLIGLSIVCAILLDRTTNIYLRGLPLSQIPLFLTGIYALLTTNHRQSVVRFGAWDALYVGFTVSSLTVIIAFGAMGLSETGSVNYCFQFFGSVLPHYILFLLCREGMSRRGFDLRIVLAYAFFVFCADAALGIGQSLNLMKFRGMSSKLYQWPLFDKPMDQNWARGSSQPWQGRGAFSHSNGQAAFLAISMVIVPVCLKYSKSKVVIICAGLLAVASVILTYSRGGLLALAAVLLAWFLYLAFTKQHRPAMVLGLTLLSGVLIFVTATQALNIRRFNVLTTKQAVKGSGDSISLFTREYGFRKAVEVGMRFPLTGISATGYKGNESIRSGPYRPGIFPISAYAYSLMMFGVPGLIFVVLQPLILLCASIMFAKKGRTELGLAACGLAAAIAVEAFAENILVEYSPVTLMAGLFVAVLFVGLAQDGQKNLRWNASRFRRGKLV